jgi:15-cis-phytoene desaturase
MGDDGDLGMSTRVAVLGGGIAGLSAAHHLVRANVADVHVYEASDAVGGKARSQWIDLDGHGTGYPGEHGFRFFPHFYKHVTDTMRSTPVADGETAWDRLVEPSKVGVAGDGQMITIDRPVPFTDVLRVFDTLRTIYSTPGITAADISRFLGVLVRFACSSPVRRKEQIDKLAWTEYVGDESYSDAFRALVLKASQSLSAMRASESSAATIGAISLQMMFQFGSGDGQKTDAILNGPTDESWLQPWQAHLESRGVRFKLGCALTGLEVDRRSGAIRAAKFGSKEVRADYFIAALPLEAFAAIVEGSGLAEEDRGLRPLLELRDRAAGDMVGLQFYLRQRCPIVHGHVQYPATPFALTSVSQAQFWKTPPEARVPGCRDVLSVILSDWTTPGTEGLAARDYRSRDELLGEVWRQMKAALPAGALDDDDVIGSHLDRNVGLEPFRNSTPLLIHPVGQWALRPRAQCAIPNLFLASDYVRTHTDLASMEGADEAARRAVRAVLDRMEIDRSEWPAVVPFSDGVAFDAAKAVDDVLFRLGVGTLPEIEPGAVPEIRSRVEESTDLDYASGERILRVLDHVGDLPQIDWSDPDPGALDAWRSWLVTL